MNEAQFEQILRVDGPVTLDVSANSGAIRIRGGEPGVVTVRGILRPNSCFFTWGGSGDDARRIADHPPVEQNGNFIRIGDAVDRWLLRRVSLLVEIFAPADTKVRALADSADLLVEGINGPVECETDSGEILISNIREQVSATADSGAILIRHIGDSVEARADSGSIDAIDVAGRIEVKTDSGSLRLSQTVVAPVYAKTDSGAIAVKLADTGGYTLRVRTDDGRVDLPALTNARSSGREYEGVLRGGGSIVDLETDSGAIEVV